MNLETIYRNTVRAWMRAELQADINSYDDWCDHEGRPVYLDSCRIANLTALVENAAHEAFDDDHDKWLDDETHWIWTEAINIAEDLGVLG